MTPRRPTRADLQQVLDEARARFRVPGAAAGVVHGDREIAAVSGVTSVDNPLSVDDRTLFMVGSTSKTFTATALMRLVDQGKVSLDDRVVVDHLPDFRLGDDAATRALTVRHLVTHTGGWDGDIDLDTGWGDDALARYVAAMREQPQHFPPGAVWAYNNAGFSVAGRIIEVVTGTTFEQAVTDLLLHPLGMHDSFFFPLDALTRRFAVGHSSAGRSPKVAHTWGLPRALAPAGGLISTVRDQLTWARFHLGDGRNADGKRLLKARTMRLMQSDLAPAGTLADTVGVSWLITDIGGVRSIAHGGNVSNIQLSSFRLVPSLGFAVTVLTNAGSGRLLHDHVERWAMARFAGVVEPAPVFVDIGSNGRLAEYAGTYTAQLTKLEVTAHGRSLRLTSRYNVDLDTLNDAEREMVRQMLARAAKPLELRFTAPDRVAVARGASAGARAEFLRATPDGPVQWLRWGGRVHVKSG
jgi:CubicO group peptidase (beta-lactamase class C family)